MIQKEHLENFLRINGIPTDAPEDEIRNVLGYARWNEKDIEMALLILSGGDIHDPNIRTSHLLMNTDGRVSREALASILGVQVHYDQNSFIITNELRVSSSRKLGYALLVAFFAVAFAISVGLILMYMLEVGPYYVPVEESSF